MNNKRLEYILVIVLTWLHVMVTTFELGNMPIVKLEYLLALDRLTIIGFVLWLVYGASLYFVVQIPRLRTTSIMLHSVKAMFFGFGTVLIKCGLEYISTMLTAGASFKMVAIADEVDNLLAGVLLMFFLHIFVGKKKINFSFSGAGVPLMLFVGTILVYIIMVATCYSENYKAIETFNANAEEIRNLDFHFAQKIVSFNPLIYGVEYIFFWWFMNRLTEEKTQNGF